jgi:uncharacterized Rossmann fold enzyme
VNVAELANRHQGADIYVIGSGGSLNYLDPGFFDGKITIGINRVALVWRPTTYSVTKYHEHADTLVEAGHTTVVSAHQHGNKAKRVLHAHEHPDRYIFDHNNNQGPKWLPEHWPTEPDQLVASWSTITSGMHLAAYLGAANIILVGVDGGQMGDAVNVDGYYSGSDDFVDSVRRYEVQTLQVKAELIRRYGVRIYGLSPFINPNLEGVPYIGANRINC